MNRLYAHRDSPNAVGQAVINKEDVICRYAGLFDYFFINPSVRLYHSEVTRQEDIVKVILYLSAVSAEEFL